jgi:hypothetical protein
VSLGHANNIIVGWYLHGPTQKTFLTNAVTRMGKAKIVFHGEVAARKYANRLKFRPFKSILTYRRRIFRVREYF